MIAAIFGFAGVVLGSHTTSILTIYRERIRETGEWKARQWATPTAVGWSTALLALESSRARVFDEQMRSLAKELKTVAGRSVWATDLESAKEASRHLEPLLGRFNAAVTAILPNLY